VSVKAKVIEKNRATKTRSFQQSFIAVEIHVMIYLPQNFQKVKVADMLLALLDIRMYLLS